MATHIHHARGTAAGSVARDRAFFLAMALAIAVTAVSGFALQFAMGRSSLASPWWVHLHGLSAVGWLALYVTQNVLVFRGSLGLHRRLGWLASVYLGWMVIVGITVTVLSAMTHRIPPFFEPNVFIVMDWTTTLMFAGLTAAGVVYRRQTDWHRRLMLCGAIMVMAPGLGRLLPLPLMGPWFLWSICLAQALYLGVAATYDMVTRGTVHPAYVWGFGGLVVSTAAIRPLAFSPPVLALTAALMG